MDASFEEIDTTIVLENFACEKFPVKTAVVETVGAVNPLVSDVVDGEDRFR